MLEPCPPIEGRRPDRFRPPHCPRIECSRHLLSEGYRCPEVGSYFRQCDPKRRVPRYRCPVCGKSFSRQTFAATYYMKRPELLEPIAALLVAGCAHRQIARSLGCAPSTVTRIAARLGRQSILLQAEALAALEQKVDEPIVFDHFETFVFSQDDRLAIGTPVGHDSWFCYGFDPAPHRRAGRRSAKRTAVKRPLPAEVPLSYVRSTERVVALLERLTVGPPRISWDDHPAYRSVARTHNVISQVFPNPPRGPGSDPDVAARRDDAMFPVDLLHKLIRHSQAHHRRETIAFGRRSNAVLERMALMCVWRNFVKDVSERRPQELTPAMRVGVAARPWNWGDVLSRRRFPGRTRFPPGWERIYRREWITPAVGRNVRHELKNAY